MSQDFFLFEELKMDCVFCKIVSGEIPAKIVYEDEQVLAFNDVNPVAPVHVLVIPKKHIVCVDDINSDNKYIIGDIFFTISKVAKKLNLASGYRIINNCKEDGGQTVNHLHFHLLGGKKLGWPGVD